MAIQHLRSSTANKRPDPTALSVGQLSINYEGGSPGVYFKDDAGALVKIGPVHVGTSAPNVSPAGSSGNAVGEVWLDTTGANYTIKIWDGSAWRNESSLTAADIGVTVQAYDADTAKTDIVQTFTAAQRASITTLTDGANISVDFASSNNFVVTLDGNRTLDNPTNQVAGQSGSIFIAQDGVTGSRTLAYGTDYEFAGGTAPTLSTAAGAVDRIDYIVRASGSIHCVFTANYS